ncbi:MAG: hypothetical protein AB9835_02705 [Eubacteriales bacterium]
MKKTGLLLTTLVSCLIASSCTAGQADATTQAQASSQDTTQIQTTINQESKTVDIIKDITFKTGFTCNGKEHADGVVGTLDSGAGQSPEWTLAQWACKYNIADGERTADDNGYMYTTPTQKVKISWKEGDPAITLELKASGEYTALRKDGEPWPHLLIEQTTLSQRCPTLDKLESLRLELSTRISYFTEVLKGEPGLHAAQVNLYFTVQNPTSGDMYWFGVPVFDNRTKILPEYMAQDLGKADASQKFIYTVAQKEFTRKTAQKLERLDYDKDILPYIKSGLTEAKNRGYLPSDSPADYTLTTCNLGYEMPGVFDSELEIYKLALTGTKK